MDRYGHFDLLTAGEPTEISMKQSPLQRVDLPVLKDHVVDAFARDIQGEYGVDARVGTKYRGKLLKIGRCRQRFCTAAVNHDRDLAFCPQPAVHIFSATFTFLSFYYNFFCHNP